MFLAIASVPLLLVSVLTFTNYKNSLEANRFSQLRDLTIFRADRIEAYFAGLKSHIEIAQGFYNIKKNLPVLIRLADDPNNPEFLAAKNMLDGQLQQMQSVSDLSDIMLVNPQGKVVYAIKPGHYSKDMSNGIDAEQKAFTEGKSRIYFSDVYFDKVEDNRFETLLTAPASDFNGVFIGVIAFEVDMTPVYKLIQDVNGLGNTGEVLVSKKIGNQAEFLNPLRHDPNAALNRRVTFGDASARPTQEAVQGKTGSGQAIDYRGKKVIAAWRYIPSLDWGLVAKIDTEEAFADVTNLRNLATAVLIIVIVISGITAFSIAQSISVPIKRLSEGAQIIGSGNLDYKIGTRQKDEIGQLSRSFDKMTLDLKQTTASRDELNREIIERKQAEEALRENKKDLDHAQAVAHSGSWRLDVRQDKLTWSDESYRIFGVPAGTELTYESLLSYIHPDDKEYVDTKWKAALAGEKYDIEHRIIVDGQIKWVRERAELEFDKAGNLLGGFGTVTDITRRKQTEDAFKFLVECGSSASGEDFFQSLARYLGQALGMDFVCIDRLERNLLAAKTVAVYFDGKFEDNVSYTLKDTPCGDVVGKPICCFAKDVRHLFPKDRVLQDMAAESYVGTTLWSSQGQPIGLIAIIGRKPLADTTLASSILQVAAVRAAGELERRQAEEALRKAHDELARSNKDLEQFAYVASHDLQEPLRAVSGFVELLRRNLEKSLDAKTNEYMNFAIDGAKRMQSLISGLLEYSRVGTQGKKPKKTDSKEALDEAIARLATSIKESGAEINADGLPVVYFDDGQLSQLFQNLIGNAIKFRGEQPLRIHINATHQDAGPERGGLRHWRFAVRDNGIGIEPQYAERIFMIFQRLHGREKYPGTGIGLSICKKIVERHNGKIWVESKPGNGSTFYFTVPDLGEA
jgi:PAS domain S-box-containing protein